MFAGNFLIKTQCSGLCGSFKWRRFRTGHILDLTAWRQNHDFFGILDPLIGNHISIQKSLGLITLYDLSRHTYNTIQYSTIHYTTIQYVCNHCFTILTEIMIVQPAFRSPPFLFTTKSNKSWKWMMAKIWEFTGTTYV